MFCTNSAVKYSGNGVQIDFFFPFEYFNEEDVKVLLWDDATFQYKLKTLKTEYFFVNASTIRFAEPPPFPPEALPGEDRIPNVVFIRISDVSEAMAVFTPGSSIRAQDLNDNFDQVRFGLEELRCLTSLNSDIIDLSWQKSEIDTLYSDQPWQASDTKISTNLRSQQQFWNKFNETVTSLESWSTKNTDKHVPTALAVERHVLEDLSFTIDDQRNGRWAFTDSFLATAGAIAERHDTYLTSTNPVPNSYINPGKFWINSLNHKLSYWHPQGFWVNVGASTDPPVAVRSSRPPNPRVGDLWYDTTKKTTFVYVPSSNIQNVLVNSTDNTIDGSDLSVDPTGESLAIDGTYEWVDVRPAVEEAPIDGNVYGRKDGDWVLASAGNGGGNNNNSPNPSTGNSLLLLQGAPIVFTVTVGLKSTFNRFENEGHNECYYLNGNEAPVVVLSPGRKYRFMTTSIPAGYKLKFASSASGLYGSISDGVVETNDYLEYTATDAYTHVYYCDDTGKRNMGNALINLDGSDPWNPFVIDALEARIAQLEILTTGLGT